MRLALGNVASGSKVPLAIGTLFHICYVRGETCVPPATYDLVSKWLD